jgi:hypothetical protein
MRSRSSFLLTLSLLAIPAAALAAAPFATPPQPDAPLGPPSIDGRPTTTPPVAAPPFDFDLPTPPDASLSHPEFDVPQGPPDPLPSADAGIPDLTGIVDLPDGALDHVAEAPPFGGEHGGASFSLVSVPEPATGTLIVLGLAGLAMRKRRAA